MPPSLIAVAAGHISQLCLSRALQTPLGDTKALSLHIT